MATRDVRLGGAAFALLFTAYNTAQNYLTSLVGEQLGSLVLALVYGGILCATPFAPGVVPQVGVRRALVMGSATYAALMLALTLFVGAGGGVLVATLLCMCAFLNGWGGALLWSAQGSLVILSSSGGDAVAAESADECARQAGDFWGLFQLSAVAGNLWAVALLLQGGTSVGLFATFSALAIGGSALFLGLSAPRRAGLARDDGARPPPPSEGAPSSPPAPRWREEAGREAVAMGRFVRRARSLAPLLVLGGLLMSYQFGQFPLLLTPAAVGAVFTAFGCAEAPSCGLPQRHTLHGGRTAPPLRPLPSLQVGISL